MVETSKLQEWVEEHSTPTIQIDEIMNQTINNLGGVRVVGSFPYGVRIICFYFSNGEGVFFLCGEPYDNEYSEIFDQITASLALNK